MARKRKSGARSAPIDVDKLLARDELLRAQSTGVVKYDPWSGRVITHHPSPPTDEQIEERARERRGRGIAGSTYTPGNSKFDSSRERKAARAKAATQQKRKIKARAAKTA